MADPEFIDGEYQWPSEHRSLNQEGDSICVYGFPISRPCPSCARSPQDEDHEAE